MKWEMKNYREWRLPLMFVVVISASLFVIGLVYNIIGGKDVTDNLGRQFFINLPFCTALGIADCFIINRIYRSRIFSKSGWRILTDIIITTLMSSITTVTINYIVVGGEFTCENIVRNSLGVVPWNWIMVLQIELYLYSRQQTATEKRLSEIAKERALFQFEALKNQINPHFLFNSLNILASLAYQDADKTNLFAKKLSSVYRYLLSTHGSPTVTLSDEMQFLSSYIYLEKIRFGDTLDITISGFDKQTERTVIPTSIQMLVENALKHNINTTGSPLHIMITATNDGICVTNNLQPRSYVPTGGTGLTNLQRQYTLYNKRIEITNDGREFKVTLPFVE